MYSPWPPTGALSMCQNLQGGKHAHNQAQGCSRTAWTLTGQGTVSRSCQQSHPGSPRSADGMYGEGRLRVKLEKLTAAATWCLLAMHMHACMESCPRHAWQQRTIAVDDLQQQARWQAPKPLASAGGDAPCAACTQKMLLLGDSAGTQGSMRALACPSRQHGCSREMSCLPSEMFVAQVGRSCDSTAMLRSIARGAWPGGRGCCSRWTSSTDVFTCTSLWLECCTPDPSSMICQTAPRLSP